MTKLAAVAAAEHDAMPVLVDRFGRVHRSLRVSVTDVCNIRCQYCMPAEQVQFLPASHLLSFDHIQTFVRAALACGIRKVRLTGGEPLLRPRLSQLVGKLNQLDGLQEIALTTNGMLLPEQIHELAAAGLRRVNISLDTLSEETFKRLSRREGLKRVLAGIEAALAIPDLEVKLNALVLRDVNLKDVFDLIEFACQRKVPLRFIEFMPLDSDRSWSQSRMVSGQELRERIEAKFGRLEPVENADVHQPARDFRLVDADLRLGFIDSVSQPFCSGCDRLRLTADGKIRNCLFGSEEWDVGAILRSEDATAVRIAELLSASTLAKHAAHGIASPNFQPPQRAMYQIGG